MLVTYQWAGIKRELRGEEVIKVGSVAENQSGLTIGSTYYVQIDGTLDTASVSAIKAGRAIAADKLLITEGNTA